MQQDNFVAPERYHVIIPYTDLEKMVKVLDRLDKIEKKIKIAWMSSMLPFVACFLNAWRLSVRFVNGSRTDCRRSPVNQRLYFVAFGSAIHVSLKLA